VWYGPVLQRLRRSGLFVEVTLIGAKIRASLSGTMFLDIHFDPISGSYSYALVDLTLPYLGDKRIFGWDDYPHEGVEAIRQLPGYPHHFQRRASDGAWVFEESSMRGDVEREIGLVLDFLRNNLKHPPFA
jgi:hypothetical protein